MGKNNVYVLRWYGPFPNVDEVKRWEDEEGNDTFLYIFKGMKEKKKKLVSYYCGQAYQQSVGARLSNQGHHIEEVSSRPEHLNIWVAKFDNKQPSENDVNIVENMLIAFLEQCLVDVTEETLNRQSLSAPKDKVYIINEWYDINSNEISSYAKGSLYNRIPDVISYYPETKALYCSSKISYKADLW